jgi:hypothetical protein
MVVLSSLIENELVPGGNYQSLADPAVVVGVHESCLFCSEKTANANCTVLSFELYHAHLTPYFINGVKFCSNY